MPNKVNFAFDMTYCMYFMIVMYGAVFPKLYTYLLRQRKAYMEGYNKNKKEWNDDSYLIILKLLTLNS